MTDKTLTLTNGEYLTIARLEAQTVETVAEAMKVNLDTAKEKLLLFFAYRHERKIEDLECVYRRSLEQVELEYHRAKKAVDNG